MDIRTFFNETKFDIRSCGILKKEDKVLISNEEDGSQTLPGGAIKIGETTEQAVVRELLEETNLHVKVERLVAVVENFFILDNIPYQQLIFVYELSLVTTSIKEICCKEETVSSEWLKKNEIRALKPHILEQLIYQPKQEFQHLINKEREKHVSINHEKLSL